MSYLDPQPGEVWVRRWPGQVDKYPFLLKCIIKENGRTNTYKSHDPVSVLWMNGDPCWIYISELHRNYVISL